MRVLFIIHDTDPYAGSAKSLLSMIDSLKNQKNEIEAVCPDENGLTQILRMRGINVTIIPFRLTITEIKKKYDWRNLLRRLRQRRFNLQSTKSIICHIKEFDPDIIHENTSVSEIGYLLAKKLYKPYIVHIREYGDKDFKWYIYGLKKRLKNKITYSISITKDIQKNKKLQNNPHAFQIYNGIISELKIRYNENKAPFLLYAGRIQEPKGTLELIKAFNNFCILNPDSQFKLKLAGAFYNDEYYYKCLNFIKENSLEKKIDFLGSVTHIEDLMFDTVATIIPSKFEGLGRVMPEAIANGSLCIVHDTGGLKEQMEQGYEYTHKDIALRYNNEKELTKLLNEVYIAWKSKEYFKKGGQYYNLIKNAQHFVKNYFSIESYGPKIINTYNKILLEFEKK